VVAPKTMLKKILVYSLVLMITSLTQTLAQSNILLVLNKAENNLAFVDADSMKAIGKVPVGDGPHEVVFSADGKTAFVANYGARTPGSSISVIDTASGKELRRFDVSPLMRPHGLLVIGGKLYFTAEVNRLIARYDPVANKIDWLMGTGQNGSHMVVGTADQKRFYTANIGSDSVTSFEFQNIPPAGSKVTQIAVGKQPEAIDLSPDGKEVWAGLNAEDAIAVVDTATNTFKEKIKVGGRPYRVKFTPDGKLVVNTMAATKELLVIDAATRKEVKRIKLESAPLGIVFSADGKTAFVSVGEADFILKINLERGEVLGKIDTGKAPDGIAVAGI